MDGALPYPLARCVKVQASLKVAHIFLIRRNSADNVKSFTAFLTEMLCNWLDIIDALISLTRQKGNPVRSADGKHWEILGNYKQY